MTLTSVVGYTPEIWKLGMNSLFHMVRVGLGKQHLFFRRGGRPAQGHRTAIVPRIKYVIQYLAEGFPKKKVVRPPDSGSTKHVQDYPTWKIQIRHQLIIAEV